jgi:tetratricopeptide (TPR) repeat protein
MAYALKSDTAQVLKKREGNGAWFGYEPRHVPFSVKPTDDAKLQAEAKQHLQMAITWYEKAVKQAPENLSAQLGLAWCVEQSGDKKQAIELYREVIKKAWEKEKDMKMAGLGWHSITGEAGGYLMPLLDADKDKVEIAEIKARSEQLARLPRPITPIAVPLRDGLTVEQLVDRSARVRFDADGSGVEKSWTWITPDAGWLVFDPQQSGQVTSALQMFGNVSFWLFWDNGYQALASLDDNGDGVLSGAELKGLAIWHDANGNGRCDPGEVRPLSAYGIVSLSCRHQATGGDKRMAAYSPEGVRFTNGKSRPTYDIILEQVR